MWNTSKVVLLKAQLYLASLQVFQPYFQYVREFLDNEAALLGSSLLIVPLQKLFAVLDQRQAE